MGVFISPKGNSEVWAEKPSGYLTPEEWQAAHPAPVAVVDPEEEARWQRENELAEIDAELAELDLKALRPLRAIAAGTDTPTDRARLAEQETRAAALRVRRAELTAN